MVDEGELTDIRKTAKTIVDKNVPVGARYTSDGPTQDTFTRLTGGAPKPVRALFQLKVQSAAKSVTTSSGRETGESRKSCRSPRAKSNRETRTYAPGVIQYAV